MHAKMVRCKPQGFRTPHRLPDHAYFVLLPRLEVRDALGGLSAELMRNATPPTPRDVLQTLDFSKVQRPSTKMMLIVGNPEQAFDFAALPNDGVGLARLEFIIANHIGIHPQVRATVGRNATRNRDRERAAGVLVAHDAGAIICLLAPGVRGFREWQRPTL